MNSACGIFLIFLLPHPSWSQAQTTPVDTTLSPGEYFEAHLEKYACAEYFQRRDELKSYQQKEYFSILANICSRDPFSAIIDYLRMELQVEYSLNHNPIYCKDLGGYVLIFSLDWVYPRDPWKRKGRKN